MTLVALPTACSTTAVTPAAPASVGQLSPAGVTPSLYDPARDLGLLFHDVQMARVFPDSKTFVDSKPRSAPEEIAAKYLAARGAAGFDLRAFVQQNFDAPRPAGEGVRSDTTQTMEEHIRALWPALSRAADVPDPHSSLIPLPGAYVVPGGRFREVYYWDSYFTMLG
ncbi:MAG TPA: trehalase family glycosidase, partial [Gemmatimonadaceae bacterium]|nr:trehalase family glycosidase [Gemmatimonadaceae bacterium]